MNKKKYIWIILLLISSNIWSQNNTVRIDGQFLGYDGSTKINYTISPAQSSHDYKEIQPDSLGRFTIIESIDKIHYFFIYYRNGDITHRCRLVLQPGKNYSFVSRGYKTKEWDRMYSPDIYSRELINKDLNSYSKIDLGQILYNKIDDTSFGSLYNDDWDLTHPDLLIDTLQSRINTQLSVLNRLLKENQIDQKLYDIIKLNIEYINAYQLVQTISDTWQLSNRFGINDSIKNRLYKVYPKIFELYPVKDRPMQNFFGFERYVDHYMLF